MALSRCFEHDDSNLTPRPRRVPTDGLHRALSMLQQAKQKAHAAADVSRCQVRACVLSVVEIWSSRKSAGEAEEAADEAV